MKIILSAVVLIFIIVAVTSIPNTPCSGEKYKDHPALVNECMHQQSVNSAYPNPIEIIPYPEPIIVPIVSTNIPPVYPPVPPTPQEEEF